ncbi:MAG: hypothetical protein ABI923_05185 [bacterium]
MTRTMLIVFALFLVVTLSVTAFASADLPYVGGLLTAIFVGGLLAWAIWRRRNAEH